MGYWVLEYRYLDLQARAATRGDHLDYMRPLADRGLVVMGGPIGDGTGAMVVFECDSEEQVREVIAGDPYTAAGAAGHHVVRPWQVVLGG